jgi:hypothetical protein
MCFRCEDIRKTEGYDERWFFANEEHSLALEMLYHDIPIAFNPRYALIHRSAPRALAPDSILEREVWNNIWAAFKYFSFPMAAFIATGLTMRRFLTLLVKRGPSATSIAIRGARQGIAGIPGMWATHKPIPVSRLARHNRWFWQSFYAPRQVRQAARKQ